jgi:hypothetical protein
MRLLIILGIILSPIFCTAQKDKDPCRFIKKEIDDMKGVTTITTTYSRNNVDWVIRTITAENKTDFTFLYFTLYGISADYSAHGVYVKCEDGTLLKEETVKIDCDYESSYRYSYSGYIQITADNIEDFTTKKIVKIQLDNVSKEIKDKEAIAIANHVACVYRAQP